MNRRTLLAGVASLPPLAAGCSTPQLGRKRFELGPIQVENRDDAPHEVTIAVLDSDDAVFIDSGSASPAEWDGDDLVRQGGIEFDRPVADPGNYTVHVRVDDGPMHALAVEEVADKGDCVSVRPNVERAGGFHFEYAYESAYCSETPNQ